MQTLGRTASSTARKKSTRKHSGAGLRARARGLGAARSSMSTTRKRRRAFVAALFALILCGAAATISLRWQVALYLSRHTLLLASGCMEVVRWPEDWQDRYGVRPRFGCRAWLRSRDDNEEDFEPLNWLPDAGQYNWGRSYARVPLWIPIGVLLLAAAWLRLRSRAPSRGRCLCGYDLRASPDRCPECGSFVPTQPHPQVPSLRGR